MATIQIKRGLQEAVESLVLAQGEMAVALDTGNLYVGTTSGTVHVNPKGGTAQQAEKLQTPRAFSITGDGSAQAVNFDGTDNVQLNLVLSSIASLTAGTYTKVTVDAKGRVTAGQTIEVSDLPSIPSTKISGLGSASAADTGVLEGNVPVVQAGGKLSQDILPDLSGTYVPVSVTINGKPLSSAVSLTALDVGAVPESQKGAAGGVAELDSSGKVPASQLPSYVDDVQEYDSRSAFPQTGEDGKIYIAKDTNLTYRWTGTQYTEVSPSLALGETSSSAYRGDRGKTAYDHSQETGNAHNTTASQIGAAPESHMQAAASSTALGHIKAGAGLSVGSDGTMSISAVDGGTF